MPSFAKEKFLGGLKDFAKNEGLSDISSLRFVDSASGETMEVLELGNS